MAVAGKVAITLSTENGGAWSADVTYDRLVAVKHNNNLYISRKTVANVEPPNDEFWFLALEGFGGEDVEALIDRLNELSDLIQAIINGTTQVGNAKTLDGHGAEYFVNMGESLATSITEEAFTLSDGVHFYRLGGSYYTGNDLPTSNYAWSFSNAMVLKRNNGSLEIVLFSERAGRIAIKSYDGSWNEWSEYATTTDLANYLPLTGGKISKAHPTPLQIENTVGANTQAFLEFLVNGVSYGHLGFDGANNPILRKTDGNYFKLLHTGNKPTGTYTGNGDATARTINTGGIGNLLFAYRSGSCALVTPNGAITLYEGGETSTIPSSQASFSNGTLRLANASGVLNPLDTTVSYQVL